ncbi:MAG: hypothetical protein JNN27_14780 [Planctomycetes bacterium]|nr:hypothetical protein [Planctomycetota bacterium]
MNASAPLGRSSASRALILFILVDALVVLSIVGWVATRGAGESAQRKRERPVERRVVMAESPEDLAAAVFDAAQSPERVRALTALASSRNLSDAELGEFVETLVRTLGDAPVLDVSVVELEPDARLEYELEGVRYAPNLTPLGRIRLHQADLTHTTVLFGRDDDGYRIAFAAPSAR